MRQALHIFKKDVRQFRYLILLVLAWTAALAYVGASAWYSPGRPMRSAPWAFLAFSEYGLPVLWACVIALVIHAEPLAGDRQFWLTRPYVRSSLIAAKALFVLVIVLVPLMAAQAAMVVLAGLPFSAHVPGLVWEQVLVALMLLAPMVVLAAVTRSFVQFVFAAMVFTFVPWFVSSFGAYGRNSALSWISVTAGVALGTLCAVSVLTLQYFGRRTLASRVLTLAGSCAALGLAVFMPWRTVASIQTHFLEPLPFAQATLAAPERSPTAGPGRSFVQLAIDVHNLPDGARIACDANTTEIQASTGRTWHEEFMASGMFDPWTVESRCPIGLPVPADFLDEAAQGPVHIRAALYVTVFGSGQPVLVRVGARPMSVPGLGLCSANSSSDGTRINCWSAFHGPRVVAEPHGSFEPSSSGFSYSPFPADLRIQPIEERTFYFAPNYEQPTVTTRTPIAHLKLDVDVENVHLRDYEVGG